MPFLHPSVGWGTSSPHARDGRPRAADTRDTGFRASVTVAAQQSGYKSSGLYCMGRAQERVYREKIRTVAELQRCTMEEWKHLYQCVIDNAVKQWRKRIRACVTANSGHFEYLLRMVYSVCC